MKSFTISAFFFVSLAAAQTAAPPPKATSPVPVATPPAAPSAPAIDPNKVVIAVGNEKITAAQFDQLVSGLPPQVQAQVRGAQKRQFVDQIVQLKVVAQEAERRKVDQKPSVQQQLAIQRENVLATSFYQDLLANTKVDDASTRKYYDEHKGDYEQIKAHHILIRVKGSQMPLPQGKKELTDEEALAKAQEVRKKLVAGEDFAKLAKAESDDTGSGANGGDLGEFHKGQMVPAFDQAATTLAVGQISEPIKTPYGYHIIRVDSRSTKPYEEVKAEIEKKVRPDLAKKEIEELRKNTPVTIDPDFLPPAPAAAPAALK